MRAQRYHAALRAGRIVQVAVGQRRVDRLPLQLEVINHQFCSVCGIKSFASGTGKDGVETRAINVRCLDDVDVQSLPTPRHVDGKSR